MGNYVRNSKKEIRELGKAGPAAAGSSSSHASASAEPGPVTMMLSLLKACGALNNKNNDAGDGGIQIDFLSHV